MRSDLAFISQMGLYDDVTILCLSFPTIKGAPLSLSAVRLLGCTVWALLGPGGSERTTLRGDSEEMAGRRPWGPGA